MMKVKEYLIRRKRRKRNDAVIAKLEELNFVKRNVSGSAVINHERNINRDVDGQEPVKLWIPFPDVEDKPLAYVGGKIRFYDSLGGKLNESQLVEIAERCGVGFVADDLENLYVNHMLFKQRISLEKASAKRDILNLVLAYDQAVIDSECYWTGNPVYSNKAREGIE